MRSVPRPEVRESRRSAGPRGRGTSGGCTDDASVGARGRSRSGAAGADAARPRQRAVTASISSSRPVRRQHRGETQPAEARPRRRAPRSRAARVVRGAQVAAVVADVHAGQGDLAIAPRHQRLDLIEHDVGLLAPAAAARGRHDAERAAVLAAVLDLDEAARSARRACQRRDGDARAPSSMSATRISGPRLPRSTEQRRAGGTSPDCPRPGPRPGIARDRLRVGLRVAAGHDEVARPGCLARCGGSTGDPRSRRGRSRCRC